jgi:hypothetical protein
VERLALLLIFALGLGLRLYDLTDQPLDFHPTRQLRAAIITRGMYYEMQPNADPALRETAISIASTMEAYEPPLFERLVAATYLLTGGEHLWIARLYSILFWLIGGGALYALARRLTSFPSALASLAFYLALPFAVVASRSFQPDPMMVMWMMLAAYFIYAWNESEGRSWKWAILAGISSGMAILLKASTVYPVALMLLAGVFTLKDWKRFFRLPQVWALGAVAVAIPAVYYLGMGSRSASFASFWIFSLSGLLLDHKFYNQWLGMIRGLMDLGFFFAAILGALLLPRRGRWLSLALWGGYLLVGLTLPFQIYTHDYYSIILVPVVALGLAGACEAVVSSMQRQPRTWQFAAALLMVAVVGYYAWVSRSVLYVQNYRNEPIPWQKMAKELPDDGAIIALTHDYGNRLKYYGWRTVNALWASGADMELAEAAGGEKYTDFETYFTEQTRGMSYFLVTLFSDLEGQPELKDRLYSYPIAAQGDGFILFDLRQSQ